MSIDGLLGALAQSGMTRSTAGRITNSLGGGGMLDSLAGMLGGGTGAGAGGPLSGAGGGLLDGLSGMLGGGRSAPSGGALAGGALSGTLGSILKEAGKAVGGNQNLALGGLGALAGSLLGGGRRSVGGALGGGLMAMLGVMAFQALKKRAGAQTRVPLGLAMPQTAAQKAELARNSELVLKAMVNAAKADGQIDQGEIQRLLGKVQEGGVSPEEQQFLKAELAKPMQTAELVAAAKSQPGLAAQLYGASLLAIEVDTSAEKEYLSQLAQGLGLEPQVVQSLHQSVGL